ncbi:MAG TPA: transporter, partial [Candidatus Angelobacter sp.]|nr:transporter [Candidatus Angelobacter sp.]
GLTYANMEVNYSSDTLKNGSGNTVPLTGSYNVWAIENVFYYVFDFKFLGGKLAPMITFPTLANGSLTLGSLSNPSLAVSGGGFGLADTWVQPLTLGWSLKRADVYVAYAFTAPTGRYTPGASDNVGSGYWGNNISTGTTVYITKDKGTTANLFTNWETHGSKTTGAGTKATPGDAFTDEWGIGQVLPLKKDFSRLLQLGVVGYDQWQVSDNGGLAAPNVPANLLPYYSAHAIGFQANYLLPAKNLSFFFKFEDEYKAVAHPVGPTIVFGGSWTLRIPKPTSPTPPTPPAPPTS